MIYQGLVFSGNFWNYLPTVCSEPSESTLLPCHPHLCGQVSLGAWLTLWCFTSTPLCSFCRGLIVSTSHSWTTSYCQLWIFIIGEKVTWWSRGSWEHSKHSGFPVFIVPYWGLSGQDSFEAERTEELPPLLWAIKSLATGALCRAPCQSWPVPQSASLVKLPALFIWRRAQGKLSWISTWSELG